MHPSPLPPPDVAEPAAPPSGGSPPPSRGEPPRIRFIGLSVQRAGSGRCRATVTLEAVDGVRVDGAADVEPSAAGDLRAAAAATLDALHGASRSEHRFSLSGVKSVRAFDQHVVLVQLALAPAGAAESATRLVGSAFADGDLMRATVLAVLNASNRVLWAPAGR